MPERLRWSLRWRLSVLWMLQWGITGAILTYLPLYFADKGLKRDQLGELMAVGAIGLWVAPFLVGQICDRWLGAEKYLAASHFLGGLALLSIPIASDYYAKTGRNFGVLTGLIGFYAVAYFPTVPVASALTFRHLPHPETQFGRVRMWGTVGWVLAGLFLSLWLGHADAISWLERTTAGMEGLAVAVRSHARLVGIAVERRQLSHRSAVIVRFEQLLCVSAELSACGTLEGHRASASPQDVW